MVQKLAAGAAVLAAAVLALPGLPASAQSDEPVDPPESCESAFPEYDPEPLAAGEVLLADQEIEMSDGIVLRADVHLPAGLDGPFPATLTITGYNKTAGASIFAAGGPAEDGYAVVVVDDRGTGTSGGSWDSWGERTQADYPEILDWIVEQPWSNGDVALTGGSYMGITALFTAASGHPAVKAVFVTVPMGDSYRDIVFGGGQVNTAFIPLWMGLVTGLSLFPSTDPSTVAEHLLAVTDFQVPTVAESLVGGGPAFDGAFWRQRSPLEVVDQIEVPTFIVGGLDDIFQRGEPMLYEALADHVDARLLIGPWTHGSVGSGLPAQGIPSLGALQRQWLDAHMRGIDTGIECIPAVTQFVRGSEKWATAPTWPIPGLHAERWHLRGDASLTPQAPESEEAGRQYLPLPVTGICTRSANQWLIGILDASSCASDNSVDESLALTWTSEPFTEPVRIDGPIQADLWVESTLGGDALASVAVSSVSPDGTSRGLTNGQLLASHRAVDPARARMLDDQSIQPWHPFTEEAVLPVAAGEPMHLPVEVFPTSVVIPTGHRLRVTVAAYDVPHALPPAPAVLETTVGGPVTVLSEPEHPSSIVIPVVTAQSGSQPTPVAPGASPEPAAERLPATGSARPVAVALLLVSLWLVSRWTTARVRA